MESEWNKLSADERAEFAVWAKQQQAGREQLAEQRAAEAAKPKRYADMTPAEQASWLRKHGLPTPRLGMGG